MVRAVTKKDVVAEFRRSEIVEAAKKVFAKRGYRSSTVDDIAAHARIAKGTLYLYFKSKEEIYLTALMADIRALQQEASTRITLARTAREKIAGYVAARLEHSDRNADFWRIFFSEFTNLIVSPATGSREFQAVKRDSMKQLQAILEQGMARREIHRLPAERTTMAIVDLTRCVIERRIMGYVKSTPREDLAFIMDVLWDGLAPRKGSHRG